MEAERVTLADLGFLFREADLHKPKAKIAERRLQELNPFATLEPLERKISLSHLEGLTAGADLVLTQAGSTPSWLDWQAIIWRKKLPWLLGWLNDTRGYFTLLVPGLTPCLTCSGLIQKLETAPGFLTPLAAVLGGLMALAAMNFLSRRETLVVGRLFTLDWAQGALELQALASPAADCPRCGRAGQWPPQIASREAAPL